MVGWLEPDVHGTFDSTEKQCTRKYRVLVRRCKAVEGRDWTNHNHNPAYLDYSVYRRIMGNPMEWNALRYLTVILIP
jgi:hypothetical protein